MSGPFLSTPNTKGDKGSQQQQQLLTPPATRSSTSRQPGDKSTGNATSNNAGGHTQGELGQPGQPGGRPRRYTSYPDIVSTQQRRPTYQSNGRRRRRTQVELLMHHAIAWLGYGAVVPNVSVETGEPLVDGLMLTHGTCAVGGDDDERDVDDLVERVSRSLMMGVNKEAAHKQRAHEGSSA